MKYLINLLVEKIVECVKSQVSEFIQKREDKFDERIQKLIKEESYTWLPHGACWLCAHPVRRSGGYEVWRGRMFCGRDCTKKFAQIISNPDEDYQRINGDPVEVVKQK